jgi:hypothetical protein
MVPPLPHFSALPYPSPFFCPFLFFFLLFPLRPFSALSLSFLLGHSALFVLCRQDCFLPSLWLSFFTLQIGRILFLCPSTSVFFYSSFGAVLLFVSIRAAQTGVYIFFDVSGFKASFGVKWLTDIDKQPVENLDIQVKNARLSGPSISGYLSCHRLLTAVRSAIGSLRIPHRVRTYQPPEVSAMGRHSKSYIHSENIEPRKRQ